MWKFSVALLFLSLAVAPQFCAQAGSPDAALPDGPMQTKATTACLECHDARIIRQQRLSRETWAKEVDKMMKWGALVDPKDRDALIDYLAQNFGPNQPAYVAPRSVPLKTRK